MLKLERVAKKYKGAGRFAVRYLDLDIPGGEIFGFLGPNGAGKTTTIKMIVGLLEPDQGKIRVNGFDLAEDPVAVKRSCGFVPDNPSLYPRLTGLEYLNLIGDVFRVPSSLRKERIDYYLGMFELTGEVGDLIQSYSRGMRQKLALTGALLHNPPLFILDEPMVGLDPKSSHLFKEVMREHVKEGNTVFFSTHVLEVAEKFCDRVGIISHGKLIACGTIEELRQHSHQEDSSLERIFLQLTEEGEFHEK